MALKRPTSDTTSYREWADTGSTFNPAMMSVCAWVKPHENTAFATAINKRLNAGVIGSWGLSLTSPAPGKFRFVFIAAGGQTRQASASTNFTLDTWNHWMGVYDKSNIILYWNGNKTVGEAETANMASLNVNIRCFERNNTPSPSNDMNCDIAEVGLWSVPLTQAEATALASGACPLSIRPASLFLYDPMFINSNNRFVGSKIDFGTLEHVSHPRIIGVGD